MKIAIDIAQGLRYLYTELQPPFDISELNSNSIYATEDFIYKLNFEIHLTIAHDLIEIILMSRLATPSTEAPLATQQESSNMHVGVGMQISEASLHKAMVNVPTQGSSSVFVR